MTSGDAKSHGALGFLTVLEHEQQGLVGGYLILNPSGRPLEFHCTAPVKPNRAQQILFGPTLESYLYGEQIGQTLLTTSALAPWAVWTDVAAALAVRDYVSWPVALVLADENAACASQAAGPTGGWRVDAPHHAASFMHGFEIGRNRLAVAAHRASDREAIAAHCEALVAFDLSEPFERIREAVEEAHKQVRG
jgi:hypothetical protein